MYIKVLLLLCIFASIAPFGRAASECSMTTPCPMFQGGQPFRAAPQVRSQNGLLNYTLVVDIGDVTVDWLTVKTRLYNNMFPGPTFRLKPGDKFNLLLMNNLTEPNPGVEHTDPYSEASRRFPNTTNMHTHGLHISPHPPQDDTLLSIEPQGEYQYRYEILQEHNPGTFWYHPHKDGSVNFQILGMMSGMIIIEDEAPSSLANVDEVELVLQPFLYKYFERQIKIGDNFRLTHVPNPTVSNPNNTFNLEKWIIDNKIQMVLVNGVLQPVLQIEAGKLTRFRIVNCGGRVAMSLTFVGAESCDIKVIAMDGIYFDQPKTYSHIMLLPGNRADVLLLCGNPQNVSLESHFPEGDASMGKHPMFSGKLMKISVGQQTNRTGNDSMITELPKRPSFIDDLQNVQPEEIHGRYVVEISRDNKLNREFMTSMKNYRFNAKVGTVQEWRFVNSGRGGSHPMHIHINSFQIIEYSRYNGPISEKGEDDKIKWFDQNGSACLYQDPMYHTESYKNVVDKLSLQHYNHPERSGVGYVTVGEWRDVVLVPPLSDVKIRFRTDRFTGPVVIHCHRTDHEDEGMMMMAQIVSQGEHQNTTAVLNVATGKNSTMIYPQACMTNELEGALSGIHIQAGPINTLPSSSPFLFLDPRLCCGLLLSYLAAFIQ